MAVSREERACIITMERVGGLSRDTQGARRDHHHLLQLCLGIRANLIVSNVGTLIAMHHGLILKKTNGVGEPDRLDASRCRREPGTNEMQGDIMRMV